MVTILFMDSFEYELHAVYSQKFTLSSWGLYRGVAILEAILRGYIEKCMLLGLYYALQV